MFRIEGAGSTAMRFWRWGAPTSRQSGPRHLEMSLTALNGAMPATAEQTAMLEAEADALERLIGFDRRPAGASRRGGSHVVPDSWPSDLLAVRSALQDPAAVAQLDATVTAMCADATEPTPSERVHLQRMLEGARRRGGGDLETGLKRQLRGVPRSQGAAPPITREEAARLLGTATEVRRRRPALEAGHPLVDGSVKALGDLDATVRGKLIPMLRGSSPAGMEHQIGVRNQLDGSWAEWEVALETAWRGEHAALNRLFSLHDGGSVEVDVVAGRGTRWIQVKAYSQPFGLGSNAWTDVRHQAERTRRAAALHPVEGSAPDVTYHFHNGVSEQVLRALRGMGVGVRGGVVEPRSRQREEWLWIR